MKYGTYWTFVEPPGRLVDEAYPLSFFKWDTLIPDQPRRRFLAARGSAVFDGDVNFASWNVTPPGISSTSLCHSRGRVLIDSSE